VAYQRQIQDNTTEQRQAAMSQDGTGVCDREWQLLEEHFRHHASIVNHFKHADAAAVIHMWETTSKETGECLSQFEREALMERHCELFGRWPEGLPATRTE
jgi:hypothetical protein